MHACSQCNNLMDDKMSGLEYLDELARCELCEHRCGVNRLAGQTGLCGMGWPQVASATLHPAPPESYTIFMAGCNFKCLNCQNWTIAHQPNPCSDLRGCVPPEALADEGIRQLESHAGGMMGADRPFFSGGEPTIHLPYIERVVAAARRQKPATKVNFDTNGYMTPRSLQRILQFATSITYDLKAYHDEVHRVLTGAASEPVLRNAVQIGRHAPERLWEYRITVIPHINEDEIEPMTRFIAAIDPALPVCFLAFRPNWVLEQHPGASHELMQRCVAMAKRNGLTKAYWSGRPDIPGRVHPEAVKAKDRYQTAGARLASTYALRGGCGTDPRDCRSCPTPSQCRLKEYVARRQT